MHPICSGASSSRNRNGKERKRAVSFNTAPFKYKFNVNSASTQEMGFASALPPLCDVDQFELSFEAKKKKEDDDFDYCAAWTAKMESTLKRYQHRKPGDSATSEEAKSTSKRECSGWGCFWSCCQQK